jgi:hypothetical protein
MSAVPPGFFTLRLPLGNIVQYPTGRPSIRVLARAIEALGYEVSVFPLPHPDLRSLTPGIWHHSVVFGDVIIFIATPTAPSVFSGSSASDLSAYESPNNAADSDNFDPPDSDNLDPDIQGASSSDQSGYGSSDHNEPDVDVENGYWRS